ncbi:MAG: PilZ domain-containing protein [Desulfovibrionaceae bacterium]
MSIFSFLNSLFKPKKKSKPSQRRPDARKGNLEVGLPAELDIQLKKNTSAKKKAPKENPESSPETLGFKVACGRPDGKQERRQGYRVSYPGLVAKIHELTKVVRVRDISACGIGLLYKEKRIKAGTLLHLSCGAEGKVLAKKLVLHVIRHENGVLAGRFQDLDRTQEDALAQIVLDAQKKRTAASGKQKV